MSVPAVIDSPKNPIVQETAALLERKTREAKGCLLVEGPHPLAEARQAGLTIRQVFVREDVAPETLFDAGAARDSIRVSARAMAKMTDTDSPPPCLAVVETPEITLETLLSARPPMLVVLDRIQDPGNAGTLVRSAAAFGATGLVLTPGSVDPYAPKVIRGSAGLVFALPVLSSTLPLETLLARLSAEGLRILATTGQGAGATPYRQADWRGPLALVLGSEGAGLPDLATLPVTWVTIPMAAGVDSLNVAVSGAILLAELAARREATP